MKNKDTSSKAEDKYKLVKQCGNCIHWRVNPILKDRGWCDFDKVSCNIPTNQYCDRWEGFYCKCPHCGERLTEEEADSVCDCGCPNCQYYFTVEDYKLFEL